ncbi:MAG: hypothetical protein CL902_00740, partial [Dehalococcoidia bacterium]|nr:hypothetical protein [Dehalococcoidia bacterium]
GHFRQGRHDRVKIDKKVKFSHSFRPMGSFFAVVRHHWWVQQSPARVVDHAACPVCFEEWGWEPSVRLPCGHRFHEQCLWRCGYGLCPVCGNAYQE